MSQAGQPRRNQGVIAAEKAGLDDAREHLRRADQRARGDCLDAGRAIGFKNARQMRRHGAGDAPGRRKGERQQDHGAIDRNVRLDGLCRRRLGADRARQEYEIQRQADQHVRRRPCETGLAPADGVQSPGRQRPSNGAGETGQQGDPRDRAAGGVAVDLSECCERGVIEAEPHAEPEQQPRHDHDRHRIGAGEKCETRGQYEVGPAEHLPAAGSVDLAADPGAEQRGNHQ